MDYIIEVYKRNIDWKVFCDALKSVSFEDDLSFETFAQTNRVLGFDEKLVAPCLNMIYKIGESLKKQILG